MLFLTNMLIMGSASLLRANGPTKTSPAREGRDRVTNRV